MPKAIQKRNSTVARSKYFLGLGILFVVALGYFFYNRLMTPVDINMVADNAKGGWQLTKGMPAPEGCSYKQVQCAQAPCEPILVCETTSTTTPPANCTSWFDGCNTCTVENGVIGGCTRKACKASAEPPKCIAYKSPGPVSTTAPTPTQTPTPTVQLKPSPSFVPMTGIETFSVTKSCGPTSFLSITVICKNKLRKEIATNSCTEIKSALFAAHATCDSFSGDSSGGVVSK